MDEKPEINSEIEMSGGKKDSDERIKADLRFSKVRVAVFALL